MTLRILVLSLCLSALGLAETGNPIMPGADPDVALIDGKFWLYATRGKGGENFLAFESRDLTRWKEHGPILDFKDIPWIAEDGRSSHGPWAPCIFEDGKRFYFYYSVGPQDPAHPSRIGVAVGRSPKGPFKDSGKALITGGKDFEAIDPMVFKDPKSGKFFLYAGGSAASVMKIFELNSDLVSVKREIRTQNPEYFTEGVFIDYHDGLYHLTYSHGNYRDASYSVHYSTGKTPKGPWKYQGVLLKSDEHHKGPGHHSIFPDGQGGWLIAYHRWNNRTGDGPFQGRREIAIDRIEYGKNGLLQSVQMTDAGVKLDP
ncbi:family 43 glycosylhydrolase [Luteolibacter pohnpeiensis]|uniref:Family 43 glycosylhydrolase n=1 Tax=Luteolibacter pohnpeiensis TaxID=454153 RepID=A0A934S603_9BACT|nr:family 43 glycosylhydrolase [Luteolibacter pohnpeiensis]MBK1882872.1 family 43 glycosylhydrolase [Luteolibacter pohnpeiensis]